MYVFINISDVMLQTIGNGWPGVDLMRITSITTEPVNYTVEYVFKILIHIVNV